MSLMSTQKTKVKKIGTNTQGTIHLKDMEKIEIITGGIRTKNIVFLTIQTNEEDENN